MIMAVDDVLRDMREEMDKVREELVDVGRRLTTMEDSPPIQWQGDPATQELFPAAQDLSKIYKTHGQFKVEEETPWSGNPSMAALHNTIRELREELAAAYADADTFAKECDRLHEELTAAQNRTARIANERDVAKAQVGCMEEQVVQFGRERDHAEERRETIFDVNEILVDKKRKLHAELARCKADAHDEREALNKEAEVLFTTNDKLIDDNSALKATVKQYKSGLAGAQGAARVAAVADNQRQADFDKAKEDVLRLYCEVDTVLAERDKGRGELNALVAEIHSLNKANALLKFEAENEKELRKVTEREGYDESAGMEAEIHILRNRQIVDLERYEGHLELLRNTLGDVRRASNAELTLKRAAYSLLRQVIDVKERTKQALNKTEFYEVGLHQDNLAARIKGVLDGADQEDGPQG